LQYLILFRELAIELLQFTAGHLVPVHGASHISHDATHGLSGLPDLVRALVEWGNAARLDGRRQITPCEGGETTGEVGNIGTA